MILKIRMRESHGNGVSWRLLDKISKVDYMHIDEKIALERQVKNFGVLYINTYPLQKIDGKVSKLNKKIAEVCFTFESGLSDMFYTDDMVYIMNDNGKTCDTINV